MGAEATKDRSSAAVAVMRRDKSIVSHRVTAALTAAAGGLRIF